METRPPNTEGTGAVTQRDLVRNSLRMRPDRVIVGEVRGAEVWDMLQAMNTGHEGSMTTIHANSAHDALARLEMMVQMTGFELPMNTISFAHACFVELSGEQLTKKIDGLAKYESQAFRPYANADFIRSLARVRGVQVNTEYAEAFEAVRLSF